MLSNQEIRIVVRLAQGQTPKVIAHELSISVRTVREHMDNAKAKLNAANRAELVAKAIEHGDVPPFLAADSDKLRLVKAPSKKQPD